MLKIILKNLNVIGVLYFIWQPHLPRTLWDIPSAVSSLWNIHSPSAWQIPIHQDSVQVPPLLGRLPRCPRKICRCIVSSPTCCSDMHVFSLRTVGFLRAGTLSHSPPGAPGSAHSRCSLTTASDKWKNTIDHSALWNPGCSTKISH